MHSKAILISALVAVSAVSAAPVPAGKRCLGSCGTKNDNSVHTNTNTNTDASTTTSNAQTTNNSGNAYSAGNNGGGQDFSNMYFGGGIGGCKRAFLEGREANRQQHQARAEGWRPPPPRPQRTVVNNMRAQNTQNSNNSLNSSSTTNINKSKTNSVNQSGNTGVIAGSGNVCRREFIELEMERRELDTGASVLAAMGALSTRDIGDDMEMLATRDVGRMAETLGIRALGHDGDDEGFTHYKRDVGTVCATEECGMMKREVDDMLREHARNLGFWVE